MNRNVVLGWMALAIAASPGLPGQASEQRLSQVKLMAIRVVGTRELAETCLSALKEEFRDVALTIRDTTEGADAEMVVDFKFNPSRLRPIGEPDTLSHSFYVSSLPQKKVIWKGGDRVPGDNPNRQCALLARRLSRDLLKELGDRKPDFAVAWSPSYFRPTAARLGMLDLTLKYRDAQGAVHRIGSIGLRLSCTNPVAFSHQVITNADGHVVLSAPGGKCRIESAYPLRVEGKRYVWKSDAEFLWNKKTTFTLLGESVSELDRTGASESDTPALLPAAAAGGVEPIHPTGDAVLPVLMVGVEPEYPKGVRIGGNVILQAVIGVDGGVRDVSVLTSSNPILNNPSIEAVSQRLYWPAHLDGKPVPIYFTIRVDFGVR
jgi:hypothetical protein